MLFPGRKLIETEEHKPAIIKHYITPNIETVEYEIKPFKVLDQLFEKILVKNKRDINKCNDGIYPLISQATKHNGISKFIDVYDFDFEENVITVSNDNAGVSYVQTGKFSLTKDIHLLKLKPEYKYLNDLLHFIALIMTIQFSKNYEWGLGLNSTCLNREYIRLPTIDGKITLEAIEAFIHHPHN